MAPEPAAELPNFVTWEGSEVDRGIRFLVPVNVYLPGATSPTAPPDDYLAYLLGQSEHGATFEDVVETTVDGRPATVMTATTPSSLDGSLGCQEEGMFAADCFGLQPDLILRIAVIDTDAGPLLIWVRDIRGADDRDIEYESFDEMLASLRFRPDAEPTTDATTERGGVADRRRLDDEPDPRRAGELAAALRRGRAEQPELGGVHVHVRARTIRRGRSATPRRPGRDRAPTASRTTS